MKNYQWENLPTENQLIGNKVLGKVAKKMMLAVQAEKGGRYKFAPAPWRCGDFYGNPKTPSTFAYARVCKFGWGYRSGDDDLESFICRQAPLILEAALAEEGWVRDGDWNSSPHYSVSIIGYSVVAGTGCKALFKKAGESQGQYIALGCGPWRTSYCDNSDSSVYKPAEGEPPVFWVSFWGGTEPTSYELEEAAEYKKLFNKD